MIDPNNTEELAAMCEDAARWRFVKAALNSSEGAEGYAMDTASAQFVAVQENPETSPAEGDVFEQIADRARAIVAAQVVQATQ